MKAEDLKAADLDRNPHGTELKVLRQREKEKKGRFVAVPGSKPPTRIFVRDCEDAQKKVATYVERMRSKPERWD